MVTALTINYNTPEYLERLLRSFRKFYDIPYLVIDGSDEQYYKPIADISYRYKVDLIHFDYNIHHGPGMAYGINQINTDQVLLVDSDMIIHSGGWLEMMIDELRPESYGIGDIQKEFYIEQIKGSVITTIPNRVPNTDIRRMSPMFRQKIIKIKLRQEMQRRKQLNIRPRVIHEEKGMSRIPEQKPLFHKVWVDYLHPALALINKNVYSRYPEPIKGGAPLIEAMKAIWLEQSVGILQRANWLTNDLWDHTMKYVQHNENHNGMGTVVSTGGYHLELE